MNRFGNNNMARVHPTSCTCKMCKKVKKQKRKEDKAITKTSIGLLFVIFMISLL